MSDNSSSPPPYLPLTADPAAYARTIPSSRRGTYLRATRGSRPAAVKAMCLQCQGWEDGAVQAVRDCPCRACPLWRVRPYQTPEQREVSAQEMQVPGDEGRAERLRRMRQEMEEARSGDVKKGKEE